MSKSAKLRSLVAQANEIFDSESLSWEAKYDLIFSKDISRKVFDLIDLRYYDPDTSYEEDVKAFVNALNEKVSIES
jgi:hypothetical protein